MAALGAVLDACVLFPASLRDTLLRAADAGLYRALWSEDILNEVRRNLMSDRGLTEEKAQRLVMAIQTAFPEAMVSEHRALIGAMTNHPKDRHVLAAAVASGAQLIVTSNLKDFPRAALAPYNVEARSPDAFLTSLFDLDGERMVQVTADQARDLLRPPMTIDEVLDMLAKHAPVYASRVRETLNTRS